MSFRLGEYDGTNNGFRDETEIPASGEAAYRVLQESKRKPQKKVRPEGNRTATLQPRPARVDIRCGSG